MARGLTAKVPLLLLLLLPLLMSCFLFTVQARPLKVDGFGSGLSLGGIKSSGPAPGGDGHKFTNSHPLGLGGIKEAGPSQGGGHKFTDTYSLGGIKDAGPAPGEGHAHVNKVGQWSTYPPLHAKYTYWRNSFYTFVLPPKICFFFSFWVELFFCILLLWKGCDHYMPNDHFKWSFFINK